MESHLRNYQSAAVGLLEFDPMLNIGLACARCWHRIVRSKHAPSSNATCITRKIACLGGIAPALRPHPRRVQRPDGRAGTVRTCCRRGPKPGSAQQIWRILICHKQCGPRQRNPECIPGRRKTLAQKRARTEPGMDRSRRDVPCGKSGDGRKTLKPAPSSALIED